MSTNRHKDWRGFQEKVADLFRKLPGCSVNVNEVLRGARIGAVEVDVVARFADERTGEFGLRPHKFIFTVIVECKFWNKRVPQEKLYALKTIVEDVGGAMGVLVSELGVQSGAKQYVGSPINVVALTYTELEAMVLGMHLTICTRCDKVIIVPFKQPAGRPIFCRDCFAILKSELQDDS